MAKHFPVYLWGTTIVFKKIFRNNEPNIQNYSGGSEKTHGFTSLSNKRMGLGAKSQYFGGIGLEVKQRNGMWFSWERGELWPGEGDGGRPR